MKINKVELPEQVTYKLTCLKSTNPIAKDKSSIGTLYNPDIILGRSFIFDDWQGWRTSTVTNIELLPKGKVRFKTLNSTYLLEEIDGTEDKTETTGNRS